MLGVTFHRAYARTVYGALRGRNRYAASGMGLSKQLPLLRKGFLPVSGLIYDPDDLDNYLSDARRFTRGAAINGPRAFLLNDKLAFYHMVSGHDPSLLPVYVAVLHAGRVLPADKSGPTDMDELQESMASLGQTIVKPNHDGGGADVSRVSHVRGRWQINGSAAEWQDVLQRLRRVRSALVTEFVVQAPYAQTAYPHSTNTIRMLTMRGRDGQVFLARAVHRFGSSATAPVDNWAQGGLSCLIDLSSGELGPGMTHPSASTQRSYDTHPDTRASLTGVRVPSWSDVTARVLALAARLPLDYVGWDVVVTASGPVLIEGNSNTGVGMLQVHGPLLADARVREFYADRGLVRPGPAA